MDREHRDGLSLIGLVNPITLSGCPHNGLVRFRKPGLLLVSFSPCLLPFQGKDQDRCRADDDGVEYQCVTHVKRRLSIRSSSQSGLGCWCTSVTMQGTRNRCIQRIITIEKRLQDPQRNAELASDALVSSAPISRDTGSREIAQIPISPESTNRATALFGRTV